MLSFPGDDPLSKEQLEEIAATPSQDEHDRAERFLSRQLEHVPTGARESATGTVHATAGAGMARVSAPETMTMEIITPEDLAISELEQQIRDFITHPRRQDPLLQDKPLWNVLCSALDILGDTELAIESYLAQPDPGDAGARYLLIYGILQVLYVQQDALKNMVKAFGLPYNVDPELEAIRKIRNKTTGHPTKEGDAKASKDGQQMSHFLSRFSMGKTGYKLMTTYADGEAEFADVDIPALIAKQRIVVKRTLEQVFEKLKVKEMEHHDQFKSEKLRDCFPSTTGYMLSKISEASYSSSPSALPVGVAALQTVRDHINEFKQALERRGVLNKSSDLKYRFEEIEYPLDELERYMSGQSVLESRGAYIFAFFVRHKVKSLEQLATSIDEEYGSDELDESSTGHTA
jgi:hypothetical protein